jgi:hypothetical protein
MITFRKLAAASDGKLVRLYFTEATLDPQPQSRHQRPSTANWSRERASPVTLEDRVHAYDPEGPVSDQRRIAFSPAVSSMPSRREPRRSHTLSSPPQTKFAAQPFAISACVGASAATVAPGFSSTAINTRKNNFLYDISILRFQSLVKCSHIKLI